MEELIKPNPYNRNRLTKEVLREWQNLLDGTAEILGVPAGLITRVDNDGIEILLSSSNSENPYCEGFKEKYPESGWYCEHTLKNKGLNLIPNAKEDPLWKENCAIDLNMISYIGMPIERPDGGQFGTVCFLDNKENKHNDLHASLIYQVKRMVELSLRIIFDTEEIAKRDRLIDGLSKLYPICSYCKKIKKESGVWITVEQYVKGISGSEPSHGICPECFQREMKMME